MSFDKMGGQGWEGVGAGGEGGGKAVSNAYYLNVSKHKLQQTFSYYAVCEENAMYLYLYTVYTCLP